MAQQASPKVAGQSEDLRAQLTSESSRVVMTSGSASAMKFSKPLHSPLLQAARAGRAGAPCVARSLDSLRCSARASASASVRARAPHSNRPFFRM